MDETESKQEIQVNFDFMVVLQQMMAKPDLLFERNSQIEQEMALVYVLSKRVLLKYSC